jgi:hypothetical protein
MMRTAIIIHKAVAMAVPKKLMHSPRKPNSSTGLRPYWSDKAPRMGEAMKLAKPKEKATTPYQKACSVWELVKLHHGRQHRDDQSDGQHVDQHGDHDERHRSLTSAGSAVWVH